MSSIILILTLYFFNLTSEYSNCICLHLTVHNLVKPKHKSCKLVGKMAVTFLGRACIHDIQDMSLCGKSITELSVKDSRVYKQIFRLKGLEVVVSGLNG